MTSSDGRGSYDKDDTIEISVVSLGHFELYKDTDNCLDSDLHQRLANSVNVGHIKQMFSRSAIPESLSKLWIIPIKSISKKLN